MKKKEKQWLYTGLAFLALFAAWTWMVLYVDVMPAGETGTKVGFATLNCGFHAWTGIHMWMYTLTDWLGLVPVFVCMVFGMVGLVQWITRKSIRKVDPDILLLGVYYVIVIIAYLSFEMIPINYRPILIEGRMEASYPSSTTLLVLSVMPTLIFQSGRRVKQETAKRVVQTAAAVFTIGMAAGRLVSGVHWFTDIVGAILLSMGLYCMYKTAVLICCRE